MEGDASFKKDVMENNLKRSVETNEPECLESNTKKSKLDDETVCKENATEQNSNKTPVAQDDPKTNGSQPEMECAGDLVVSNTNSDESVSNNETETVSSADSVCQNDNNPNTKKSPLTSESTGRITEVDVGITEYMGTHTESFTAVIKQRYSDFIVNEIDEDGNIIHLKSVSHEEEKEGEDGDGDDKKPNDETADILSSEDRTAIQKIVTEGNKNGTHSIQAPEDKALRTKIHLAVKQSFPQLETTTADDAKGDKVIKVMWRRGKSRDAMRDEWPKSKKSCRYVRFVLYKENKDTMDAIGLIAKNLRMRESMFQYAGTKDRRAKTTQEITAHRVHPKKLVALNKVLWNMGLGDFRYVQQPLQLGQLSGNHFTIVLRNIQESREVVDSALTSLKVNGFINYFGMQRFGTTSIPTHKIGSTLLKGDWQGAIDLILAPRNDIAAKDKFQKKWAETKDPVATLDVTPPFCGLERNILQALMKNAKPFNALDKLPRNTRLLYLHSYQSLVWNTMASKRLQQLGHSVVKGDLVMDRGKQGAKGEDRPAPVVVTEENVSSYTLPDLVLPLPGFDVIYPNNQVGDWYKDMLSEDGLDIQDLKRPQKDYSLPGTYRHLVVTPKDVSWTHHCYSDYTKPLTLSDLDLIQGVELQDCPDTGTQSAVVLHMSLSSSCYATMALREAMRIDTSSFHQSSLNETS